MKRQQESNIWVPFDSYDGDPEHLELVELDLAIPLDDPVPAREVVGERDDFDGWYRLWRRRHPKDPQETSCLG